MHLHGTLVFDEEGWVPVHADEKGFCPKCGAQVGDGARCCNRHAEWGKAMREQAREQRRRLVAALRKGKLREVVWP